MGSARPRRGRYRGSARPPAPRKSARSRAEEYTHVHSAANAARRIGYATGRPARPLVVLAAAVAVVCAAAPTAAAAVPAAALAGAPTAAADRSPSFPGPPVAVDILPTRATLTWQPPNTEPLVTYYLTYRRGVSEVSPVGSAEV